ncbi:uncharacterized protein SRS1_13381 [Sporisorium reilianum f. sp. reilianum]|uniref:Effector family protein Eff1 n=1 Tax=Sporisorium reilianum f. sp. reilianum TaxID=72559 RepID=A0A2N8UCJ5_9BASI|nr:uncharacterized protein SRS1_13381 [Sporisorium reilianum f. sp. reilianum]
MRSTLVSLVLGLAFVGLQLVTANPMDPYGYPYWRTTPAGGQPPQVWTPGVSQPPQSPQHETSPYAFQPSDPRSPAQEEHAHLFNSPDYQQHLDALMVQVEDDMRHKDLGAASSSPTPNEAKKDNMINLLGNRFTWASQKDMEAFHEQKLRDMSPLRRSSRIVSTGTGSDGRNWIIYMTWHVASRQERVLPQGNALHMRNFVAFWGLPAEFRRKDTNSLVSYGAAYMKGSSAAEVDQLLESTAPALEHVRR